MSRWARLRHVDLTLECKYCGHLKIRQGDWFTVIHRFKCEGCNRETPMTYSDKIALFNKHADLTAIQAEVEPLPIAPTKSALALQRPHPDGALKIVARARNRTASVAIAAQKRPLA
jgi:hypothetical protein